MVSRFHTLVVLQDKAVEICAECEFENGDDVFLSCCFMSVDRLAHAMQNNGMCPHPYGDQWLLRGAKARPQFRMEHGLLIRNR